MYTIGFKKDFGAGEGTRTPAPTVQKAIAISNLPLVPKGYHIAQTLGSRASSGKPESTGDLAVISKRVAVIGASRFETVGPTPKTIQQNIIQGGIYAQV